MVQWDAFAWLQSEFLPGRQLGSSGIRRTQYLVPLERGIKRHKGEEALLRVHTTPHAYCTQCIFPRVAKARVRFHSVQVQSDQEVEGTSNKVGASYHEVMGFTCIVELNSTKKCTSLLERCKAFCRLWTSFDLIGWMSCNFSGKHLV